MDLNRDVRDELEVLPLDHDIIVGRKLVSDCVQARSRLLPRAWVFSFNSTPST